MEPKEEELIGRTVEWTSSSFGSDKTKKGLVVGYIPANESPNLYGFLGTVAKSRCQFQCEVRGGGLFPRKSTNKRLLVSVKIDKRVLFYAPSCNKSGHFAGKNKEVLN